MESMVTLPLLLVICSSMKQKQWIAFSKVRDSKQEAGSRGQTKAVQSSTQQQNSRNIHCQVFPHPPMRLLLVFIGFSEKKMCHSLAASLRSLRQDQQGLQKFFSDLALVSDMVSNYQGYPPHRPELSREVAKVEYARNLFLQIQLKAIQSIKQNGWLRKEQFIV